MTTQDYNTCVKQYSDGIFRFIVKNLRDEFEAENIVQNTFEKLWVRIDQVEMKTAKVYLFKIAYNNMIDVIRKNKNHTDLTSAVHVASDNYEYNNLLEYVSLAVNELPSEIKKHIEVNPIEVLREGPSYTIDTVEAVAQFYEGDTIVLIVGTDAYEKIDQWHRAEELKKMVEFVVIDRPEFPGQHNTSVDAIAVSATDIRAHKSDAVPAAVAAFIKENNLYASK